MKELTLFVLNQDLDNNQPQCNLQKQVRLKNETWDWTDWKPQRNAEENRT